MKIPPKLIPFISSACMSVSMACIVSGTLTAVNRGLSWQFLAQWWRAFGIAYCVALPTALLVAPVIRNLMRRLNASPEQHRPSLGREGHTHVHEHLVLRHDHRHQHDDGHHVHSHFDLPPATAHAH